MSKALTVPDQIKGTLATMTPQFEAALPKHINVDKFIRVAQTAILNSPDIAECERNSIYSACMKSAQDGLIPDGREAALVKFNTKRGPVCQYMPMVGGILKKARNSGELASITSQIVYSKDDFKHWIDEDGEHLKHEFESFEDRGVPRGVYALAKTKDGSLHIEVMSMKQLDDIKSASKSGDRGPWGGKFKTEMWRKSVIRRLCKRLPMSTDLENVVRRGDDDYSFDVPEKNENLRDVTEESANLDQATDQGQTPRLSSLVGMNDSGVVEEQGTI